MYDKQQAMELEQVEIAIEKLQARMQVASRHEFRDLFWTLSAMEEQALYLRQQVS